MTLDKSCPGSQAIREPVPEDYKCPNCGREVEIWTDELKAKCPDCGTLVFRAQQTSCIDWCPHAAECVGPEVYERLRPSGEAAIAEGDSPLEVIRREHERALDNIGLLRAAGLCLKLGTLTPDSPVWDKGIDHLARVLDFFDNDIGLHFRHEEEILFPAMEKHVGGEKSPTRMLLGEHKDIWQYYDRLKEKLDELRQDGSKPSDTIPGEVQELSNHLEGMLKEHIRKENETLLPLAEKLLSEDELESVLEGWKSVAV